MCRLFIGLSVLVAALLGLAAAGLADDVGRLEARRQDVFEFTEKPQVRRDGEKFVITFASKGYCDATVTIEDAGGRIIRHLASGVLGPAAPEPFGRDSLRQSIAWDGKDDRGRYPDDPADCIVRVSLGLAPRLERTLFHSPYKRFGRNPPIMAAAPEGVYVYEGDILDSIRLFDHDGTYLRTVYPFPAARLEQVKGLRWRKAVQDGLRVPLMEGFYQTTLFDSGFNSGFDKATGYGVTHFPTIGKYWAEDAPNFPAATAFAVAGGRIALAGPLGINRMSTDGGTGAIELSGPRLEMKAKEAPMYGARTEVRLGPRSAALSPDGKWLYMTGWTWTDEPKYGYCGRRWVHGVLRMRLEDQAAPTTVLGTTTPGDEPGDKPGEFNSPTCVACDAKGNVYVADYGNNRVQVFSPDGRNIEQVKVNRPAEIAVHPKTGELFVFSWLMKWDSTESKWGSTERAEATLTRLGPAAESGPRRKLGSCPLPFNDYRPTYQQYHELGGVQYRAVLDPWTNPPAVWLVPGSVWQPANAGVRDVSWRRGAIKVAILADGALAVKKDFGVETLRTMARESVPGNGGQYLTVNPKTGRLWVLEGRASADQVVEVDPQTGVQRLVELPHTADEIAFDLDGLIYLRTATEITRYDPGNWREVPWDYGEQRQGIGGDHGRSANVISALILPGAHPSEPSSTHCGGFSVSPKGNVVAQCWNGQAFSDGTDRRDDKKVSGSARRYIPKLFAGRQRWGEIHIWDRHGKLVCEDAVPGVTITDGIGIDRDDNLYVMTNPTRTPGGHSVFNPKTETLLKFRPGKGKVITSGDRPIRGGEGLRIPLLLGEEQQPDGPTQMAGRHQPAAWVQGAEWMFGGVGFASGGDTCWNARCALDLFGRSFAPEPDRFSVAVLDTNGNLITRIGRFGNIEDGQPQVADPAIRATRPIGGDEVSLMHACYVGVDGGRRLYISDAGNRRIVCVKLSYHTQATVSLPTAGDSNSLDDGPRKAQE